MVGKVFFDVSEFEVGEVLVELMSVFCHGCFHLGYW